MPEHGEDIQNQQINAEIEKDQEVEFVEAEIVDRPAEGRPVPTDELNPNNPSKRSSSSSSNKTSSPFDNLFSGGIEDYHPLFKQYNEAIDQQGKNIEYLKLMIEDISSQLNKCQHKVWETRVVLAITLATLIIAYFFG